MCRAVKMWDTATYWTDRAGGAIRNAKHKERPDVRARHIKTLEADTRKRERTIAGAGANCRYNFQNLARYVRRPCCSLKWA